MFPNNVLDRDASQALAQATLSEARRPALFLLSSMISDPGSLPFDRRRFLIHRDARLYSVQRTD